MGLNQVLRDGDSRSAQHVEFFDMALAIDTYIAAYLETIQIVRSGKQVQKVSVLHSLDARKGRLVGKESAALRLRHDQFIQAFGDLMSAAVGKRLKLRKPG